jgi:hypothetical protein
MAIPTVSGHMQYVRRTNAMLDTRSNSREDCPPPIQKNCHFQRLPRLIQHSVSRAVELFVNQVQEQVDIELQGLFK